MVAGYDLVSRLFTANMDLILRDIFLFLDPGSLKASRCVSHQWNSFILETLWGSRGGRRRLEERLLQRWRNKAWDLEELDTGYLVKGLVSDEERFYCTFEEPRGFGLRVYHLISKVCRAHTEKLLHCFYDIIHSIKCTPHYIVGYNIQHTMQSFTL